MTAPNKNSVIAKLRKYSEYAHSNITKNDEYYLPRIKNKLPLVARIIENYNERNISILRVHLKELSSIMESYFPNKEKLPNKKKPSRQMPSVSKKAEEDISRLSGQPIGDRIASLETHFGSSFSKYMQALFPELTELERAEVKGRSSWVSRIGEGPAQEPEHAPLPEKAPALWAEAKEPGDTPPTFIQRHYAPWLDKGLTRADVRHLDPQLYMALANWLRKNELPEGFNLPTKSEHLRMEDQGHASKLTEARRLVSRWDKRQARDRTNTR